MLLCCTVTALNSSHPTSQPLLLAGEGGEKALSISNERYATSELDLMRAAVHAAQRAAAVDLRDLNGLLTQRSDAGHAAAKIVFNRHKMPDAIHAGPVRHSVGMSKRRRNYYIGMGNWAAASWCPIGSTDFRFSRKTAKPAKTLSNHEFFSSARLPPDQHHRVTADGYVFRVDAVAPLRRQRPIGDQRGTGNTWSARAANGNYAWTGAGCFACPPHRPNLFPDALSILLQAGEEANEKSNC